MVGRPTGAKNGLDGGDTSCSETSGVLQSSCLSPCSVMNRGISIAQDAILFVVAGRVKRGTDRADIRRGESGPE